ncbi:unnamed protein product [Echinostoma caproni]|uniref:PHD-type domain-containing protein n=1 Tax=Echinostoma caproni TaxID=27848 RepID=A0A183B243_9TREM|nr:unnamed protein product [Echinostoma caproni]
MGPRAKALRFDECEGWLHLKCSQIDSDKYEWLEKRLSSFLKIVGCRCPIITSKEGESSLPKYFPSPIMPATVVKVTPSYVDVTSTPPTKETPAATPEQKQPNKGAGLSSAASPPRTDSAPRHPVNMAEPVAATKATANALASPEPLVSTPLTKNTFAGKNESRDQH